MTLPRPPNHQPRSGSTPVLPAAPIRHSPRPEFLDQPAQTTRIPQTLPLNSPVPRAPNHRAQHPTWSACVSLAHHPAPTAQTSLPQSMRLVPPHKKTTHPLERRSPRLRNHPAPTAQTSLPPHPPQRKYIPHALAILTLATLAPLATADPTTATLHPTPCDPINAAPQNIICYNATLPQHHAAPASHPPIQIALADLNPTGTGKTAAILSGGGPGGALHLRRAHALAFWETYRQDILGKNGRLILIDQRGAGNSKPLLNCPEEKAVFNALMPAPQPRAAETRQFTKALQTCRRRHAANGTDLAAFTTAASADDADAIRRALGIRRWHLIGFSYGARLALETSRRHPQSVIALVLDSPPPYDATALPPAHPLAAAISAIAANCQQQPHCQRHGNTQQNIAAALAMVRAAAAPPAISLRHNGARTLALTPARTAALLRFGLYDSTGAAALPLLARQLAKGDFNTPHAHYYASAYLDFLLDDNWATLLNWRINCQEFPRAPAATPATPLQKLEQQEWRDFFAICNALFANAPRAAPAPVITTKPVLLISGKYDPATPPQWSAAMAARLPNVHRILVPAAHTPGIALPCLRQAVHTFLHTATPPAQTCPHQTLTFH